MDSIHSTPQGKTRLRSLEAIFAGSSVIGSPVYGCLLNMRCGVGPSLLPVSLLFLGHVTFWHFEFGPTCMLSTVDPETDI